MTRPASKPSWIGTRIAATLAQRATGFTPGQTPTAELFNWIFGLGSDWIDYIDDWIQNTARVATLVPEQQIEGQCLANAILVAESTATMAISAVAVATNAAGAILHMVGVGDAAKIMRYDAVRDEVTMPTAGSAYAGNFGDVIWANGLYVALGTAAEIQTSPDGITWTRRFNTAGFTWGRLAYGGGKYVAVGSTGRALWSTDGILWNSANVTAMSTGPFNVIYAPALDKFFCFNNSQVCQTPSSTMVWSAATTLPANLSIYDVVWAPSQKLILTLQRTSGSIARLSTSADGTSWQSFVSPTAWMPSNIATWFMPLDETIGLFVSPTNSSPTFVYNLTRLDRCPDPTVEANLIPMVLPNGLFRLRYAQSTWFAAVRVGTFSRIYCGTPIEGSRYVT
jgi:hypothetical protein